MLRSQRRLLLLVAAVIVTLFGAAVLYQAGMGALEGRPRTFLQSLEWASETLSTTGYGADSRWAHPAMALLVILLQMAGVFLVVAVFPIYIVPFLEERFQARLPRTTPPLSGHIVVYRYGPAVATLVEELERRDLPVLVIEEDEAEARRLLEREERVLFGRLGDDLLERAWLADARSLIANGSDDANAAVALAARQLGYSGEILALVEEPFHRKPLLLAGATAAYTPRHILGAALAARASEQISPRVAGIQQLGRQLQLAEIRVERGAELAGRTLAELRVGTHTGATVLGLWRGGELEAPVGADTHVDARGVLVALGAPAALEKLAALCGRGGPVQRQGPFVVGGCGEVGAKVVELLRDAGEQVRVIDRTARPGVDVAGDVLDPRVLERAGIGDAQAVILALDTDTATLFATVMVRDLAPEVPVIARVNAAENVERIHRAGADFALSISQVSGQMLARRILGEDAVALAPQLKVLKATAHGFTGRRPAELELRAETGCSVVAVEREGAVLLDLSGPFRFAPGDAVYVCGSREATRRFLERYPQPAAGAAPADAAL